jgi:hypothetical protein
MSFLSQDSVLVIDKNNRLPEEFNPNEIDN